MRKPHTLFVFIVFLALGFAGCGPTLQPPSVSPQLLEQEAELQREITFKTQVERQNRLQRIYTPLRIANADICGKNVLPVTGISGIDRPSIQLDLRATAQRLYGVEDGVTVLDVAPNSPAAELGLLPRDVITGAAKGAGAMPSGWTWSGLTVADLVKIITTSGGNPITLLVRRMGSTFSLTLTPRLGCWYPIEIKFDDNLNAAADGNRIIVNTGTFNHLRNDNEIAFLIGHELAHNILGHVEKTQGNIAAGAVAGALVDIGLAAVGINTQGLTMRTGAQAGALAYSKEFEAEADYLGLYLLARAGFDTSGGPEFFRRLGIEKPLAQIKEYSSTHPSTPERAAAMTQTVVEIREKQATQVALLPSTLPGETFAAKSPDQPLSQLVVVAAQPPSAPPVMQSVAPTAQATSSVPVASMAQPAVVQPTPASPSTRSSGSKSLAQLYLIKGPVVSNPPQVFSAEFLDTGKASVVLSGRRRLTGDFELLGIGESISAKYTPRLIKPDSVKPAVGADAKGFAVFTDGIGTDLECVYSVIRSTGRGQGMCADNQRNIYRIVFD